VNTFVTLLFLACLALAVLAVPRIMLYAFKNRNEEEQ